MVKNNNTDECLGGDRANAHTTNTFTITITITNTNKQT